jgi:hypothetical protein
VKEAVKFYLDEHVSHAILKALRRNGFDVVTAHDASLSGQPDVLHLEFAARKNRVLISQDDDFLRLHSSGMQHAGILYFPQHTPVRIMIEHALLVGGAMTPEEIRNTIQYA